MEKQLKLGLDLKGGVHLELRVQTDDALQSWRRIRRCERLREELNKRSVTFASITTPTSRRSSASKACREEQDAAFRQAAQQKCRPTTTAARA